MPEAFTYCDLQRHLAAVIPTATRFRLETYNINARLEGSNARIRALKGKAKKEIRLSDLELFRPQTSHMFINLDRVPRPVLQNILLEGSAIQLYGKRIGISLGHRWWIQIHLYMHGHVIALPAAQLYEATDQWNQERWPEYSHPHTQMALINITNPSGPCIAVVDSMRLSSMTFIQAPVQAQGSAEDHLVNA